MGRAAVAIPTAGRGSREDGVRIVRMKVIAGRVVDGKIEFETDLPEGTPVAVLAAGDSGFCLRPREEEELAVALAEIRNGKFEDGRDLIRQLKGQNPR